MITIHHLGVSQSERIIWLCEELGLPYELKVYARDPSTMMAPPALQAVHPLGSAPVITEGQRVLAESSAIVEYLLERYGKGRLRPATSAPEFPDYLYWLHYANGSLMPNIMLGFILGMPLADNAVHPLAVMFGERVQRHFQFVEDRLGQAQFVAGSEFTAADLVMHFPFGTMRAFAPIDLSRRPNTRAWLARISARPAYQKAMRLAGHERDPAA